MDLRQLVVTELRMQTLKCKVTLPGGEEEEVALQSRCIKKKQKICPP